MAGTWSCIPGRTTPEPVISSLVVRNRSFFDVNVYVLPSPMGAPARMGTVVGASSESFALRARDLQPGGFLVVLVHAIGSRSSWTSDAVSVGDGVLAILDVSADVFGNCSASSLHTIVTVDSLPPPAGLTATPEAAATVVSRESSVGVVSQPPGPAIAVSRLDRRKTD